MGVISVVLGLIAIFLALLSLLPLLWWLNWVAIPLAVIGFVFGAIGLGVGFTKGTSTAGLLINLAAAAIAFWRLS